MRIVLFTIICRKFINMSTLFSKILTLESLKFMDTLLSNFDVALRKF